MDVGVGRPGHPSPSPQVQVVHAVHPSPQLSGRAALRRGRQSDGRMASCPVVPMVDDPMTAHCPRNAHCIWPPLGTQASCLRQSRGSATLPPTGGAASSRAAPWGRGHLACGSRAKARPFGDAASSRATYRPFRERGRPARLGRAATPWPPRRSRRERPTSRGRSG